MLESGRDAKSPGGSACGYFVVGGAEYGYIPFFVTLDDVLRYGEQNVLHVTVHNENQPSSRWYTGGGIYRPVWLWIGVQPVNHGNKQPAKGTWRGTNAIASWSFKGCEGAKAVLEVYSGAAKVEIILNGKSLGKKAPKLQKAVYKAKYVPGTLEVVTYDVSGCETGRKLFDRFFYHLLWKSISNS